MSVVLDNTPLGAQWMEDRLGGRNREMDRWMDGPGGQKGPLMLCGGSEGPWMSLQRGLGAKGTPHVLCWRAEGPWMGWQRGWRVKRDPHLQRGVKLGVRWVMGTDPPLPKMGEVAVASGERVGGHGCGCGRVVGTFHSRFERGRGLDRGVLGANRSQWAREALHSRLQRGWA